jgi:hypothetical protein
MYLAIFSMLHLHGGTWSKGLISSSKASKVSPSKEDNKGNFINFISQRGSPK